MVLIQQMYFEKLIFLWTKKKNNKKKPTTFKSFEMNQTFINFQYYQVNANLIPKLSYQNFLEGNS